MQAVAAIAGVLLTALVVLGIVQNRDDPTAAATPVPPPAQASVTLEVVTTGPSEVRGNGSYAELDPRSQVVLFMGRPLDVAEAEWIPVPAALAPQSEVDGRSAGHWEATWPGAPEGRWQWFALVAPAAAGAGDAYADLRRNGPDSDLALARSEPQSTD